MENSNVNINPSAANEALEKKPLSPINPDRPKLRFKTGLSLSLTVIVLLFLAIIVIQILFLAAKNSTSTKKTVLPPQTAKIVTPTPAQKNTLETKSYTNLKYGFQVTYPAQGQVLTDRGIVSGQCGNAIREVSDQYTKEGILIDNFFEVVILDWYQSVNEYLKSQNAGNFYNLNLIATSSAQADEAYNLVLKNNWQSLTSSPTPPLPNTINIYKKGNKIFLLNALYENVSLGGCINPDNNFVRNFWGSDNFKFISLAGPEDKIAGWKAYTMPIEKLIIRFPPNWAMNKQSFPEDPTAEGVTFTSPNNFQLAFSTAGQFTGFCSAECQSHNLPNTVLTTLNFYTKPLYVVVHGLKDDSSFGSARTLFSVVETKSCFDNMCSGYTGQRGRTVIIQGGFIKKIDERNFVYVNTPVNDFINSQDVKNAIKILENLRY